MNNIKLNCMYVQKYKTAKTKIKEEQQHDDDDK